MFFLVSDTQYFHIKSGAGRGANMRAKLLSLWGLLFFASQKGIKSLMVDGNSNIIVAYMVGSSGLNFFQLEAWKRRIQSLQESFEDL